MRKIIKDPGQIVKDFFDIDEAAETAKVRLHFDSPKEIFDVNCMSKTPIFSDDFDEWLQSAFVMIPSKYKLALDITFDDMDGYTSEQLDDIFKKNLSLSVSTLLHSVRFRDGIAIGLIAAGIVSFIVMMLAGRLWDNESFWHDVFFYIFNIATTVLFWEAAGILFVETREHRRTVKAYRERFESISFSKK